MSQEWRLPVTFAGEGAGEAPLAWGQQEIWSAMCRQETWLPIGGTLPAPPGATLEGYADELRFTVERHQSMRTLLKLPDGERARQLVHDRGEIGLTVVDVGPDEDPAAAAEQVRHRFWTTPYDARREWPVRMAVVRRGGVPTHVVAVYCHLVMDAFGGAAMMTDLAGRDPDTGIAAVPPPAMQPLAQARWQASPAGVRQNTLALRHWDKLLRTVPPRRFPALDDTHAVEPGDGDEQTPRYWEAEYVTPVLPLALRTIAAALTVDTSPILLTALFTTLVRLTGDPVGVAQVVVSNRFRPGLADVVAPINQTGLCVADLSGLTFAEAVAAVRRAMMGAYKHAYYDPLALDELIASFGDDLDIATFFNDRRLAGRDEPGDPVDAGRLEAGRGAGEFRWSRRLDEPFERLFVHVEDARHGALMITVCADTRFIPPRVIRAIAYGIEAVLIEAAIDTSTPVRAGAPVGAG